MPLEEQLRDERDQARADLVVMALDRQALQVENKRLRAELRAERARNAELVRVARVADGALSRARASILLLLPPEAPSDADR